MTTVRRPLPSEERTLTIAKVETIPIRVPLARTYSGSNYYMTHRSTVVTRVVTSEGIVGEAYAGDEDEHLAAICSIIRDELAPALTSEDGFAVERLWELARPSTFHILREKRVALVACAAVDAAIWDAIGKAVSQPLWRLWGGYTSRRPVIAIGGYYGTSMSIEDEIADLRERGFAGLKFKVGGLAPEEDAARFQQARAAAGADFVLMADANQAWSTSEAIRFARLVADHDLHWFEEPCHWGNDRRAMRDVRAVAGVPVCAGQSELSAAGCRDLMEGGAIDYCNFDASWSGGPTEWRRVAALASVYGVQMAHHEEPQVASHLLGSIPHGTFVECFHPDRDPIWWQIIANRPEILDGHIQLSDAPGFGWEIDWEFVARHRADP